MTSTVACGARSLPAAGAAVSAGPACSCTARRPDLRDAPPPRAPRPATWVVPAMRAPSLDRCRTDVSLPERRARAARCRRTGTTVRCDHSCGVYNLHYFDDLNARDAAQRARDWHRALARALGRRESRRAEASAGSRIPTSRRIVNWIKWVGAGRTRCRRRGMRALPCRRAGCAPARVPSARQSSVRQRESAVLRRPVLRRAEADGWLRARAANTRARAARSRFSPTAGISSSVRCTTRSRSRICSTS